MEIAFLGGTVASLYANPITTKSYPTSIHLHNTHTSSVIVTLHSVPDNASALGTPADSNKIWNITLTSGQTIMLDYEKLGLYMFDQNDSIQGFASVADKVTCFINGFTE